MAVVRPQDINFEGPPSLWSWYPTHRYQRLPWMYINNDKKIYPPTFFILQCLILLSSKYVWLRNLLHLELKIKHILYIYSIYIYILYVLNGWIFIFIILNGIQHQSVTHMIFDPFRQINNLEYLCQLVYSWMYVYIINV